MKSQAAFFFGSGISFDSEMPSVQEITTSSLSGDWHLHTDGRFYPGPNPNLLIPDCITPRVMSFLSKVTDCAADYRAELARPEAGIRPHYEDLFSLAEQAARAETDHVPNLATVEFLRRLRRDTASLHCGYKGGPSGSDGFVGLAQDACEFLHWVVDAKLRAGGIDRQGLKAISKTALAVDELDIFTLNHDTLVEQQLTVDGISEVETGFDDRSHGQFSVYRSRWWKCTATPRKRVRLLQLHGSLNWWLFEFPNWNGGTRQYAIPDGAPDHGKDETGHLVRPVEWKAAFLSGTIVKELRYGLGFWGEQLEAFRESLAKHAHLICCGYGFGDTGINLRIDQWMHDRPGTGNQLVILTPDDPDSWIQGKPYWLIRHYQSNLVKFVPKYLSDCEADDLKPFFDPL
jgi:SIR2-like domain